MRQKSNRLVVQRSVGEANSSRALPVFVDRFYFSGLGGWVKQPPLLEAKWRPWRHQGREPELEPKWSRMMMMMMMMMMLMMMMVMMMMMMID